MVQEAAGALAAAPPPDKLSATTAYIAAPQASSGAERWLPLWQWDASAKAVRVWDYSLTAARAIELGRLKVRGDGNVLPTIAPLLSATLGAE